MMRTVKRRALVVLGVVCVMIEQWFSVLGAALGDSKWEFQAAMVIGAIAFPIGEAITMHRAAELKAAGRAGEAGWAYAMWAGFLMLSLIMTVAGAATREDIKQATRVAGFVARQDTEAAKDEAKAALEALRSRQGLLSALRIHNRPMRPVAAIEADEVYNRTKACTDKDRHPAGHRVCAEHATAKELATIEAQIAEQAGKLEQARVKVASTEVVVSRDPPLYRVFARFGIGTDAAAFFVAALLSALLHLVCSRIWFLVPSTKEAIAEPVTGAPFGTGAPVHFQVIMPSQSAGPPALTHVQPVQTARAFDPAKARLLADTYWQGVIARAEYPSRMEPLETYWRRYDAECSAARTESLTLPEFATAAPPLSGAQIVTSGGQYFVMPK